MDIYNNHLSLTHFSAMLDMLWEWDSFDDFNAKYSYPNNKESHVKWARHFANLEGLGILLKKGLIDAELVYDSQYVSIIGFWEKFLPVIEKIRLRYAPHMYEDPEYLYNEMIRMRAEKEHQAAEATEGLYTKSTNP